MRITCPECDYTREVPDDKIPSTSVKATCPKCGTKFRFRAPEPEFTLEPSDSTGIAVPEEPETAAAPLIPEERPQEAGEERPEPEPQAPESPADRPQAANSALSGPEPEHRERPKPRRIVLEDEPSDEDIWQRLENMGSGGQKARDHKRPDFSTSEFPEDDSRPEAEVPWERLDVYGFFGGLTQTIKRAMLAPGLFFAAMPLGRGVTMPLVFFLLVSQFQIVCQLFWSHLGISPMMGMGGEAPVADPGVAPMGAGSLMLFLIYPVLFTIWLFLMGGVLHVLLKLFGAGQGGFEGTFRAMAYSAAPSVLAVIPYAGPFAAGFWSLVIMFIGLKVIHATSFMRVFFAFLLPLVVIIALAASLASIQPGLAPNMY